MNADGLKLTDLPVELLQEIANSDEDFDFWSTLALLCKCINEVVTPLIYADLAFLQHDLGRATKCCHTLARNPRLAGLVQYVEVGSPSRACLPSESAPASQLRADFVQSLSAMSSLRYLNYELDPGFDEELCFALTHVSATLECLIVYLDRTPGGRVTLGTVEQPVTTAEHRVAARQKVHFPQLTELEVSNISLQEHITFFQEVLEGSSSRICLLTLSSDENSESKEALVKALVKPCMSFPCLETLRVDWCILGQISASQTQTIRSLTVFGDPPPSFDTVAFDDNAFPLLESLECHHQALPHFMPPHPRTRRPIENVALTTNPMRNVADIRSLTPLCNSASTVTTLMMVGDLAFDRFHLSAAKPSMAWLREIEIEARSLSFPTFKYLGQDLFAHTPRLREFKLSQNGNYAYTAISCELESTETQHALVTEWGQICPELVYVTFTSHSFWEKETVVSESGQESLWQKYLAE